MISMGLENRTYNYKFDVDQEWSPARAEPTGVGKGPEMLYTRGKSSDHMAQKATVILDLVEKGKTGNRAIINYNSLKRVRTRNNENSKNLRAQK